MFATEQDRPAIARRRTQWRKYQGRVDPGRLVFVDETWASANMAPLPGWGPRGTKLIGKGPHGRWRTTTFIAALRCDRIDAPYVLDGPIYGQTFTAWVEQCLAPTLSPRDVVILDNLGNYKGKAVRQAIRAVGARLLFLPPYSPDPNPIEQVFAKLTHLLRNAAERSVGTTLEAHRMAGEVSIDLVEPQVLRNGREVHLTRKEFGAWRNWPGSPVGRSPIATC